MSGGLGKARLESCHVNSGLDFHSRFAGLYLSRFEQIGTKVDGLELN